MNFIVQKDTVFYNCRRKFIFVNGEKKYLQTLVCNKQIFNPDKWEKWNKMEKAQTSDLRSLRSSLEVENMSEAMFERLEVLDEQQAMANLDRAQRRAKGKVFDYCVANEDLKYFLTFTLNGERYSRYDYSACVKELNCWLDNRVRRHGLKYVLVPELHKDGALHWHGLVNDSISLVSSGTYIRPCGGKPVKASTLARQRISVADCREVFNVRDWYSGFSTCIELVGERQQACNYVAKYITKGCGKIGGRFYLHGGNLKKPFFEYDNVSFNDIIEVERMFCFDIAGMSFGILNL